VDSRWFGIAARTHGCHTPQNEQGGTALEMKGVRMGASNRGEGMTLRRAALVTGLSYLMPVSYAETSIWPKLIIHGHIEQTIRNISIHSKLFAIGIFCNIFTLIEDVVIAWALFVLLAPVNRSLSLITAWFRLIYTAIAFFAVLNLVTVFQLLTTPDLATLFGGSQLAAQVQLLLRAFRYDWSISLLIFAIHLILLGFLIYRSGYIPKFLGILLTLDGVGWIITSLQPYFYLNVDVGFLFPLSFAELLFPLWLLLRGWKIKEVSEAP
jgi:hypothetical protein